MRERYEIKVAGRLTPAVVASLTGVRARVAPRVTVLRVRIAEGTGPDRLVELLAGLGLDLVALRRVVSPGPAA